MAEISPLRPLAPTVPRRIGKYRIVRQIAQGGMAEIFLATAGGIEGFEKQCVLKRILPLLASNQDFVAMFLDEARIAASLLHSNIAQVFDIGEDQGSYYFVMEFLRGEDLRHVLQSSAERKVHIPYEHIVTIVTETCSGLHYAHELCGKDRKPLSIVHRDVSPQNIFVTSDGKIKLCDFGIAKSAATLTETRVGTLKGKIRYMSPEQCRAERLDRRSDVFSLSIVLWELVTLRGLYVGSSDFEMLKAIVDRPAPRPSKFRPDVPPGLEAIIMKGLERDRERRWRTAEEMQVALEDWARAERVPSSSIGLSSFMRELFPPLRASQEILERVSESDPLAARIREHNGHGDAGVGLASPLAVALKAGAITHSEAVRVTKRQALTSVENPVARGRASGEASAPARLRLLDPDEPSAALTSRGASTSLRLAFAASGALLVIALLVLMLRHKPSSHPAAPSQPAASTATLVLPTGTPSIPRPASTSGTPSPTPPTEGRVSVPVTAQPPTGVVQRPGPGEGPSVAASRRPLAATKLIATSRPTPVKKRPAVKRGAPARPKNGALDELLPP